MVIKRKETKESISPSTIEDVINKGGTATIESQSIEELNKDNEVRFTLRIKSKIMKKIDESRNGRVGKISRNQWILEAISKSLK
jgi:ribosomal protein L2